MKMSSGLGQNGSGAEWQDRNRNGEVEAVQLSHLERARKASMNLSDGGLAVTGKSCDDWRHG